MECFNENFSEPLSPIAQNFSSSTLRVYILVVFEFDVPIDDLQIILHGTSSVVDDKTPIRSGDEGVEFQPFMLSHITFAITQLTEIKNNLGDEVTINDVITGVIFYGTRLYMQDVDYKSRKGNASACVVLNTRNVGYQLVKDMLKSDAKGAWGNRIVFMPIPMNTVEDGQNPLDYMWGAQKMIKKKRHPLALSISDQLSKMTRKIKGHEAAAQHLREIFRNSSAMISNMIGPVEQVALANHPIKGLYFNVPGIPQVRDKDGGKRWSKVEVELDEHVFIPKFPEGLSLGSYDKYFGKYLSRIAMEESPPNKPSWEVHIIKYPTTNASGGSIACRVYHSIADGFSIMSLLLSSLRRADIPSLPLSFPSRQRSKPELGNKRSSMRLPGFFNSMIDFAWNLLNSTEVDDKTPIRSGDEGVEFHPFVLSHLTFAITQLKEIKDNLGDEVTINDVIIGVIFHGTRLYMQDVDYESSKADTSACVVLNTRKVG
ncbi:hypothetical protein L6164_028541 [Bauhinia variegata]|uniref:Uncharacterized protein n=1 Tax=Bauhinia variegata TaxID=167791 RepID=A0ACB9L5X4_BAUVA|nr:hypothetical protein L6164_028541 [Bauhinia variegata]